MRRTVLFVALLLGMSGRAGSAPNADRLAAVIQQATATASSNFTPLRAGVLRTDPEYVLYRPSAAFIALCAKQCAADSVADQFANATNDERWAAQFRCFLDRSWSDRRIAAYIQSTIGPLVRGSTFSHGVDRSDGSAWFEWDSGKTRFVYASTTPSTKTTPHGFFVRVGRTASANAHVVRLSRGLTSVDRDELTKGIRNYVVLATANADTNFESLRGKELTDKLKGDTDSHFDSNVTFGDLVESGEIDSILYPASDTANMSHWVFSCSTKTIGGDKAAALAVVLAAVKSALPYGFTQTTDPAYLTSLEYRWDRSSDRAMVSIGTDSGTSGTTFFFDVHHYITNQ